MSVTIAKPQASQRAARTVAPLDDLPFWVDLSKKSYERCTLKEDAVEVLVTDHDGFRVITGRGTQSHIDALRDAMFFPTYAPELRAHVHDGFLLAARTIIHQLWKHADIKAPVYLDGHSYGGAFMTVVAAFMVRFGIKPAGLITQGCPRVGGASLGRLLHDVPMRRMVMPGDIIPMVPPGPFFRHVCKPLRLPIPGPLLPGIGPHHIDHYMIGAKYKVAEAWAAKLGSDN